MESLAEVFLGWDDRYLGFPNPGPDLLAGMTRRFLIWRTGAKVVLGNMPE